ncbi:hypothetical protein [Nocardiopsis sp. MG754419]|uniref:hypothetical protein n=1 Tax=Nocardiopsis sp. MG754419 TaxID=2259865 RepID=UPI001BA5B70B|nr:hypothetical protein [Nocardiopsis sp. MG754419]MBR8743847.1 hypothetical protein [Nocardiopsis sp. MG754419]
MDPRAGALPETTDEGPTSPLWIGVWTVIVACLGLVLLACQMGLLMLPINYATGGLHLVMFWGWGAVWLFFLPYGVEHFHRVVSCRASPRRRMTLRVQCVGLGLYLLSYVGLFHWIEPLGPPF